MCVCGGGGGGGGTSVGELILCPLLQLLLW